MSRRWIRAVALLALVAAVAAGCGSDRKDETGDSGSSSSTTAANASTAKTFGDLESPCGDGDASAASDSGVTADAITIGYGDDAGYPQSPGLNHQQSDAIKAFVKWCNDQGGINGRHVQGKYYDAAITNVNNAVTQACNDKVFMLVGTGYSLDSAQEQIRLGCDLPAFPAFAVSPEFANGPKMIAAVPNPVDFQPVTEANYYAKTYPEKAKKMAVMYGNFAATQDTRAKMLTTWPQVGVTFLGCDQEYNIAGEADWKPFLQKLKGCGAEAVSFIGGPYPNFENVLEAADQLDYHPDWLLQANFYDDQLSKWNTSGLADHLFVRLQDVPFEYADKDKATQDYLDIVKANGGDTSDLGLHAASAFLLWAQSVKACGDDVTRDCVLEQAAAVHDWSGGGASGKADVGKNMPSPCEAVIHLEGTKWVQIHPETPGELDCDPNNVKPASGQVVDKVDLGPDRIVHKYEP
jgi:ABC-type branched-subunit amino acid transport system substrate-binding protein